MGELSTGPVLLLILRCYEYKIAYVKILFSAMFIYLSDL